MMKRFAWVENEGAVVFVGGYEACKSYYLRRLRNSESRHLFYVYTKQEREDAINEKAAAK